MDWETSKENFQPLTSGRDPKKLAKLPLSTPKKFDAVVEEQRRFRLVYCCLWPFKRFS